MYVQMTTSSMITYLSIYPAFEDNSENKQDAIDLCHRVLKIVFDIEDESMQIGMLSIVYLVSEIMELVEILETNIMREFFNPRHGLKQRLPPEGCQLIREIAREDYTGYIDWISPFLSKAGVVDIHTELEDLDAIQNIIAEGA